MADLLSVVVGGVVGVAGSVATSLTAKWWDERRQREELCAAFAAEIEALLKIVETRRHVANFEGWLRRWRNGEDDVPQMFWLNDGKAPEDLVYTKNVDKIGLLGADAADIVLFYTNLGAVRINLRVFVTGQARDFTIERRIAWVENALAIWRPTEALARSLVERLRDRATSSWPAEIRTWLIRRGPETPPTV